MFSLNVGDKALRIRAFLYVLISYSMGGSTYLWIALLFMGKGERIR